RVGLGSGSRMSPSPVSTSGQATATRRLISRWLAARCDCCYLQHEASMEFRILGPVEVVEGGRAVPLGPSKQRALLALLLLHVNEVVSRDRLIYDLWGERAPRTSATSLHTYVSRLRKVLEAENATEPRLLLTRAPGYLLALDPDQVDLKRFEL